MFKTRDALCLALVSALSIGTAAAKDKQEAAVAARATPASDTGTQAGTTSVKYFVIPNASGVEPYAGSVTITQLAAGTRWTLEAGFTNPNAKVLDLGFDYTGKGDLVATSVAGGGTIKSAGKKGVNFDPSNNDTFSAGEAMTWEFVGTDLSHFTVTELHMGNFLANGGSIKYAVGAYTPPASPVPEPSVYVLMLAGGLAVYVGARRRKPAAARAGTSTALSAA